MHTRFGKETAICINLHLSLVSATKSLYKKLKNYSKLVNCSYVLRLFGNTTTAVSICQSLVSQFHLRKSARHKKGKFVIKGSSSKFQGEFCLHLSD